MLNMKNTSRLNHVVTNQRAKCYTFEYIILFIYHLKGEIYVHSEIKLKQIVM